jgi:hypothetical protein
MNMLWYSQIGGTCVAFERSFIRLFRTVLYATTMALSILVSIRYPAEETGGIRVLECCATLTHLHPSL